MENVESVVENNSSVTSKAPKEKVVKEKKGAHLLSKIMDLAAGYKFAVKEGTAFFQFKGTAVGKAVYVAKKNGRVDLSGFCVAHSAVKPISEEQAKKEHIGRVRGTVDFDAQDDDVLAACSLAFEELNGSDSDLHSSRVVKTKQVKQEVVSEESN